MLNDPETLPSLAERLRDEIKHADGRVVLLGLDERHVRVKVILAFFRGLGPRPLPNEAA